MKSKLNNITMTCGTVPAKQCRAVGCMSCIFITPEWHNLDRVAETIKLLEVKQDEK